MKDVEPKLQYHSITKYDLNVQGVNLIDAIGMSRPIFGISTHDDIVLTSEDEKSERKNWESSKGVAKRKSYKPKKFIFNLNDPSIGFDELKNLYLKSPQFEDINSVPPLDTKRFRTILNEDGSSANMLICTAL